MGRITSLSSRAIIGRFFQTYEGEYDKSWATRLAMRIDSDMETESYKWLGMPPAVREWVGARLAKSFSENGLTITNKTWESTVRVNVDDIRRDKTGQIMRRIDEMAQRVAEHPQSLLSTFIANGTGNTNGLAYDGQFFFDTDHSEGSSGTQLNALAAAQVTALNVGTPAQPTEQEMAQAVLGVIAYMYGFLDDQGQPLNGNARNFMVMVPTGLFGAAKAAAANAMVYGTNAAVPNSLAATGWNVEVVCNPRLTWTTDFAVFRTDGPVRPFIYQVELEPVMSVLGEGSELEINENEHQYGVKASYNVGYGMWQYAARATLS